MIVAFIVVVVVALVLFGLVLLLSHGVRVTRCSTTANYYVDGHCFEGFPAEQVEVTFGPWYLEIAWGRWLP